MKVLVTGGAGFIGSHIARRCVNLGHRVCVLDDLSTGCADRVPAGARFVHLSLTDFPAVADLLRTERFHVIAHLAAQTDVRRSVQDPLEDVSLNVDSTVHLFHIARQSGLQQFMFASSGGTVYGEPEEIPISVTAPIRPQSPYGVSKAAGELYLNCFYQLYRIPTVIFRYANVYGPGQLGGEAGVVAIFFRKMLSGDQPVIYGSGDQMRDFIFIEDVLNLNERLLGAGGFHLLNVGSGTGVSIRTLYDEIARLTDFSSEPCFAPMLAGDLHRNALDISATRNAVGWSPIHSLPDGLAQTLDWWQSKLLTAPR